MDTTSIDPGRWRVNVFPGSLPGGRRHDVRARALRGAERDQVYGLFEAASRQFTLYRERTERTIPVIVLETAAHGTS